MPETIKLTPATGLVIKYSGVFDFDKLYREMHDWFLYHKYDFNEREHTKKSKDLGHFIELKWTGERKIDEYAQFVIDIRFVIEEFNKEGKMDSGKILIEIAASLNLDYQKKWTSKPFGNFLFKFYNKYVIKQKISKYYMTKLYNEATNLQEVAKSVLNLYS